MEKITDINKRIVCLGEEFPEYDVKDIMLLDFDLFVYKYEEASYEGNGFAAWRKNDKYYYHELGHCSCNGPTDNIQSSKNAPLTLEELEKIAEKNYGDYAKEVYEYMKSHV